MIRYFYHQATVSTPGCGSWEIGVACADVVFVTGVEPATLDAEGQAQTDHNHQPAQSKCQENEKFRVLFKVAK
ncbi:hypothetical protein TNCV_455361 [Trichonephila clavipes]|nr:hypothetical protein TNCV_455361 [Trichonephila clavipes]